MNKPREIITWVKGLERSLMAQWLTRDMECTVHDLECIGLNPGQVKAGVHIVFLSHTQTKL